MKFRNVIKYSLYGAVGMLAVTNANAAIDISSVQTGFDDLKVALTTVGGFLISAAVLAVAFKWIKGMIFS